MTKNEQEKAFIFGIEDFMDSIAQTPKVLATLQEQAQKSGADSLSLEDIEREIQSVRRLKTKQT